MTLRDMSPAKRLRSSGWRLTSGSSSSVIAGNPGTLEQSDEPEEAQRAFRELVHVEGDERSYYLSRSWRGFRRQPAENPTAQIRETPLSVQLRRHRTGRGRSLANSTNRRRDPRHSSPGRSPAASVEAAAQGREARRSAHGNRSMTPTAYENSSGCRYSFGTCDREVSSGLCSHVGRKSF